MTCCRCNRDIQFDARFCPYCGLSLEPRKYTRKPRTRPNGSGSAYKRGRTWTARVVVGWKPVEGKKPLPIWRTRGGFSTKREALEYCPTLIKSPKENKVKLTMQQIYDAWLPTHEGRVGKSTMDCYRAAWRYFAPIHHIPFPDIDLDDLQECLDECPHGRRTKENMKALAGLLCKYAIPRHQTDMNYAEFLHTGNDAKGTHPAFSAEHVEAIRRQIGVTPYADYVYVLIYTGFRPAELFSIKKTDYIDGILYGGIKTEAGKNRAVPVSEKIRPIIEKQLFGNSDMLFPKEDGTFLTANYFRKFCFYRVLDAAGIQPVPTPDAPPTYVPYSCRHTFANMLKDVSGSDKDKAGLIGHEDYKTTKKHYQSVELDALKSIIQQL